MKIRASCALLAVAMWGLACGKSPMAVDSSQLLAEGDGIATASRVSPARASLNCQVAAVKVKAYAFEPLSSDRRQVSFRAEYFDATGSKLIDPCGEPPVWMVTPLNNDMTFHPMRFDPFEARLIAGKGNYVVTAFGPNKLYGQVKLSW